MIALIIEDSKPLAELYKHWWEGLGYQTIVTLNLSDALQIIKTVHVDLISLDLNLPDSVATQTIEQIDQLRKDNPQSLLIVVSGFLNVDHKRRMIELGVDGYIEKLEACDEKSFFSKIKDIFSAPKLSDKSGPIVEALIKKLNEKAQ